MSDLFKNISAEKKAARRTCSVAYTINNFQPVVSTIIGEQPLFYMDYEGNYDDAEEGLFDDADFATLERELADLKKEIDNFDQYSNNFVSLDNDLYDAFAADKDFISTPHTNNENSIAPLIETLSKSRLANAYLLCAQNYKVEIIHSRQVENAAYDRKNAKILINPDMNDADQTILAARELRRHFQHRQGALIHPLMFHPDNAILVNRAQACDLVVSMIRVAWELQLGGHKEIWERIENSSMADLGRAFAREAYLDFRTINNGSAAAAVFEAWFLSERCRTQDKILIQQMLTDYQGYVFELEDATQNITPSLISALGEMPFGKNYLAEHALTILQDPVFSDVRDRSNANFLWFIKFERSFRETEHDLQNKLHHSTSETLSDGFQNETQDEDHATTDQNTRCADIVTLYTHGDNETNKKNGERLTSKIRNTSKQNKGADIIYLRRGTAE